MYGTTYEEKTYVTTDFNLGNMSVGLGYISNGTWQLWNEAFDREGNLYAGWGGSLSYYSTT